MNQIPQREDFFVVLSLDDGGIAAEKDQHEVIGILSWSRKTWRMPPFCSRVSSDGIISTKLHTNKILQQKFS